MGLPAASDGQAAPPPTDEMVVAGRYLNRLEHRDSEWRIAERLYVMDWNRNIASTRQWAAASTPP